MSRRGLPLFGAMCLIWGIPYLLIRVAVSEISPPILVFTRTAVGALILMPVVLARGGLRGLGAKSVSVPGPVLASRFLQGVPSVTVTGVSLAACAIAYAPAAAVQWPHTIPSAQVFASVAILAVVCTALAFLLFFALIAEIGPVRATVITYVNPAVASLLGVAVLHETFTLWMGIGFVLVLLGSTLATRRRKPAAAPKHAPELVTGEAL